MPEISAAAGDIDPELMQEWRSYQEALEMGGGGIALPPEVGPGALGKTDEVSALVHRLSRIMSGEAIQGTSQQTQEQIRDYLKNNAGNLKRVAARLIMATGGESTFEKARAAKAQLFLQSIGRERARELMGGPEEARGVESEVGARRWVMGQVMEVAGGFEITMQNKKRVMDTLANMSKQVTNIRDQDDRETATNFIRQITTDVKSIDEPGEVGTFEEGIANWGMAKVKAGDIDPSADKRSGWNNILISLENYQKSSEKLVKTVDFLHKKVMGE